MATGMITSVRHANGRDWWVVIPRFGGGEVYVFLLSPSGISDLNIQNVNLSNNKAVANQAVFSSDGSIYVKSEYMDGGCYIYDFDRCLGKFSNCRYIKRSPIKPGGLAISSNSEVLYLIESDTIMQYDLTAGNIQLSGQVVAVYDSFASPFASTFFQAQLALDGKIYISCGNAENVMHVIEHPDSLGMACEVRQHGIPLVAYNAFGIPNYPNFRLKQLVGSPCDTLGIGIEDKPAIINARLYPNPSKSWFIFEPATSLLEPGRMELFSIYGELVAAQKLNPWQGQYLVNIDNLPAGMYVVKVSTKKGVVFNGKIIKQ